MTSSDPASWFGGFRDAMREVDRERTTNLPVLERYDVLDLIGEGAAARVYRARDRQLDRVVAIKVMREVLGASDTARERFQREARTAAFLAHPNIVAVHDAGMYDGRPFLVMELVDGLALNQVLRDREAVGLRGLVQLLEKAARGMALAHDNGVVHRDLKPGNILVGADGEPKIGDFGLAQVGGADGDLTRTGTVMGTPLYMAPEQVQGRTADISPRSDVYALGAILYEMITGRPPHTGESVTELYGRIVGEDPVPPRRRTPGAPVDLETVCLKALEKDPERRYASAGDFAEDLRRCLAGEPILARPPGWGRLASAWLRRRRLAVVSALALAVVAALGAWGARAWKAAGDLREEASARERGEREAMALFAAAQSALAEAAAALYDERTVDGDPVQRVAKARQAIEEGIRKAPHLALGRYLRGRASRAAGDDAAAEKDLRESIRLDADFGEARFELGRLLLQRSTLSSLSHFKGAEEGRQRGREWAEEAAVEFERAMSAPGGRNHQLSVEATRAAIACCRGERDVLGKIAGAGLAAFKDTRGVEEFHVYQGLAAVGAERLVAFDRALAICPGHAVALFARGAEHYLHTRRFDAAVADFSRLVRVSPGCVEGQLGLGLVLQDQKDFAGSLAAFDALLRLDPGHAQGLISRGQIRILREDWDGSIADAERAMRVNPRLALPFEIRAVARRAKGDKEGATLDFEQASRLLESKGRLAAAAEDLQIAIELAPHAASIEAWRARLADLRARVEREK